MIKTCEICGRQFTAKRSDARFCSVTCRQRNRRGYVVENVVEKSVTTAQMTIDEVNQVVCRAHCSAEELSRASLLTPSPLCLHLGRAAKGIEGVLRGEGL